MHYSSTMDYGDGTMTQAVNIERLFAEFFHNIKATLRRLQAQVRSPRRWADRCTALHCTALVAALF